MNDFLNNYMPQQYPRQNEVIVVQVQGESSARMYPVARGNTVLLIDFNARKFWIKSTDGNGFPGVFTAYSFTEDKPPQQDTGGEYVSKAEFNKLTEQLAAITAALQGGKTDGQPNVSSEIQRICADVSAEQQRNNAPADGTKLA